MTASQSMSTGLKVLAVLAAITLVPMVLMFGVGMIVAIVQKVLQAATG